MFTMTIITVPSEVFHAYIPSLNSDTREVSLNPSGFGCNDKRLECFEDNLSVSRERL